LLREFQQDEGGELNTQFVKLPVFAGKPAIQRQASGTDGAHKCLAEVRLMPKLGDF
jgi:diphthamide synthase (EF-2-diphthine--ammonia ligase)